MKNLFVELPITTDDGEYLAHYSAKGLAELDSPIQDGLLMPKPAKNGRVISPQIRDWHRLTTAALKKMFAGKKPEKFPPIDWSGKTEFQKSVWQAMLKISPGKTKSYGDIAAAVGRPRAVRAVGSACGANPIPVLIPCHRVIAANKKIGGFGGGLERKRELLAREGIKI
jgi:methylated-DNA-[protein]-cysteine S-methyltransferase